MSNCPDIRTSIIVSGTEIDTPSKLGEFYLRLERKLECRVGFPVRYTVETHPIRNRIVWKSARDCYEITLVAVMKDGKWVPERFRPITDAMKFLQPELYSDSAIKKRIDARLTAILNGGSEQHG